MIEIDHDTWMLSGSGLVRDGVRLRKIYSCDLDMLSVRTRLGNYVSRKFLMAL